jgi:hypothetical protein
VREDPIFSGGWIKAALVVLVAGALGVGAYLLVSGVDINLPNLKTSTGDAQTTLNNTTLEDTTVGQSTTAPNAPPATHSIQQLQELAQCTQAANGDLNAIQRCFDRLNGQ